MISYGRWEIGSKYLVAALVVFACVGVSAAGVELPEPVQNLLMNKRYAEALPILRKLAAQQNQSASLMLGNYYICGKIVPFSCSGAEKHFANAMRSTGSRESLWVSALAKNEVAWINAACRERGFKGDGEKAYRLVTESANAADWPYTTDTLAAVLARRGEFDRAVDTQLRAIQELRKFAESEEVEEYTFDEFEKRLSLYRKRQAANFDASSAKVNCNALPE